MFHFIIEGVTAFLAGVGILGIADITLFHGRIGVEVSKYTSLLRP